jgi:hypothetical protein
MEMAIPRERVLNPKEVRTTRHRNGSTLAQSHHLLVKAQVQDLQRQATRLPKKHQLNLEDQDQRMRRRLDPARQVAQWVAVRARTERPQRFTTATNLEHTVMRNKLRSTSITGSLSNGMIGRLRHRRIRLIRSFGMVSLTPEAWDLTCTNQLILR